MKVLNKVDIANKLFNNTHMTKEQYEQFCLLVDEFDLVFVNDSFNNSSNEE